jgi:gas vesicle protein
MSDQKNGVIGTLLTFLTGAAIGAGLALLYAPQSGEETRKKLKDVQDKVSDDVKENYEKFSKEAQKTLETVKTTSEKTISQIKSFLDGAKEGLKKEIKEELKEDQAIRSKKASKA